MRVYWGAFLLQLKSTLRYRTNALLYLPAVLIPPLAIFFLWSTVLAKGATLGTYDLSSMVTYYLITQFFAANTPFVAWTEISESIRDGRLAIWLVRPASHYRLFLARLLGSYVFLWLVGIGGVASVAILLRHYVRLQTDPTFIVAAVLLWLGGVVLGFTLGYALNLLAFWTQRVTGTLGLVEQMAFFLSGAVIPLDLLPLHNLWLVLPFQFAGWVPAQVYLGRIPKGDLWFEFLKLAAWLAAGGGLVQLAWRRGLGRFQGPGG